MSAAPKIIEGTWEEIARHSQEFAGHHLKVIVMDPPAIPTSTNDKDFIAYREIQVLNPFDPLKIPRV